MRRRTLVLLLLLTSVAIAGPASALNRALDANGTLFTLDSEPGQLTLSISTEGADTPTRIAVPGTSAVLARHLSIDVDNETDTVVITWQQNDSADSRHIMLATYRDGTWFGPVAVAGDSEAVANPVLLVHRVTARASDGTLVSDAFIHLAWWQGTGDGGRAMYAAMRLDDSGIPALDELAPVSLSGLLPYGISCSLADEDVLEQPKFFIDPGTGDPHLLVADLRDCLFAFVRISSKLEGDDGSEETTGQRRRNVIVFGVREVMSLEPDLDLASAKVEVGHALSVVLYWDTNGGIRYVHMDKDGWSPTKTLSLSSGLSHEQAVDLIRGLTR